MSNTNLMASHITEWNHFWEDFEVKITGNPELVRWKN